MRTRISVIGLFLLGVMAHNVVEARKPAVDPVQEISIEEYNDVPPEKAKAFDFSQTSKKNITKKALVRKQVPITSIKDLEGQDRSFNFLFLLVFALPLAVWFSVRSITKSKEEDIKDNVTALKSKKDSDDDINYPKAG